MTKPSRWALAPGGTLAALATSPAALAAGGPREVTVDAAHPTGVMLAPRRLRQPAAR